MRILILLIFLLETIYKLQAWKSYDKILTFISWQMSFQLIFFSIISQFNMIFFRVKSCFCLDLKTGSLIIGIFEISMCIVSLLVNIFMDIPSIKIFVLSIFYSILNGLVLFGIKRNKRAFLLPWIFVNIIIITILLGALIWIFVQFFNISTKQPEPKLDSLFLTLLIIFGM